MRFEIILTLAAMLSGVWLHGGENLLPNGNFDAGKDNAENWETPDGLTSFWVDEPGRGRVLKMDSRVDRIQAKNWWEQRKKSPESKQPQPEYPKKELATIASNEGVMLDSDFIPVKKGQNYKLTVDYKGKFQPIIWIKGFMFHPLRKYYTDSYQTRLVPEGGSEKEWKTFSIGFNPTARMPRTEKMKVRFYAYWPPGVYYFDNIRVEEISPEEMAALVEKRSEVKKQVRSASPRA
ncbi:MAG: hypothetical protein WC071_09860 [Victivallaceae bacterium]